MGNRGWFNPRASKPRRRKDNPAKAWVNLVAGWMRGGAAKFGLGEEVLSADASQQSGCGQRVPIALPGDEAEVAGRQRGNRPGDCGSCRYAPRIWVVGEHPKLRTGDCECPDFMFPRVIVAVGEQFWTAGNLVRAGCDGWERSDHVDPDAD